MTDRFIIVPDCRTGRRRGYLVVEVLEEDEEPVIVGSDHVVGYVDRHMLGWFKKLKEAQQCYPYAKYVNDESITQNDNNRKAFKSIWQTLT